MDELKESLNEINKIRDPKWKAEEGNWNLFAKNLDVVLDLLRFKQNTIY